MVLGRNIEVRGPSLPVQFSACLAMQPNEVWCGGGVVVVVGGGMFTSVGKH